ncbi:MULTISPECIES: hypothetical protein [Legionella]|uniref:Uncharacterized protein n=1 Tax=Legionella maceachernii TaxID=466 RepID=A0A0W0W6I7_9GAMM|nr:hypothetical protein [Legionella maceachernii]KTD28020.1 hypothetical protein Lmac_1079 [Legionella maceachernii]SKA06945.1 hypothetical protein SAMN02745128_01968 [Legionella maceachernii]SUO99859.1 Uncharacterised protein [Legionella maceachernii]
MEKKTWGESGYDILNKEQNITTRFSPAFGMRSITISRIDNLAQSIDFDPALTESINQKESTYDY